MGGVVLRDATARDVDDVLEFWAREAHGRSRRDSQVEVRRLVEHPTSSCVLAIGGGVILGSLAVGWDGWRFSLYRLAVASAHRGAGIGTRLVQEAEGRAQDVGADRVDAMVAGTNEVAAAFWASAGYTPNPQYVRWERHLASAAMDPGTAGTVDGQARDMPGAALRAGLVPELDVADLSVSVGFYTELLGFRVVFERRAEGFLYLALDGAELMLQQAAGPGRRFRTAPLERPYGRGVNFQLAVPDVDAVLGRLTAGGYAPVIPMEERWYQVEVVNPGGRYPAAGPTEAGNRQFVVADPDGYLWRPFEDLGVRSSAGGP